MPKVDFSVLPPGDAAFLPALLEEIRMPGDTAALVLQLEGRLPEPLKRRTWEKLLSRQDYSAELAEAARVLETDKELAALVLFASLSRYTLALYQQRHIDGRVFVDSMSDLTVWERACRAEFGHTGLERWGWLQNTLRLSLFRLGRFQFEPSSYHSRSYAFGGLRVEPGDPVLNIHIPEGGPMSGPERLAAYKKAYAFFSDFPRKPDGSIVFACDSWLLYPAHREMLPLTSNVRDFLNDFTLMDSSENRGDYGILWRVFGPHYTPGDWDSLPENTGLQRAYKRHLQQTDSTGGGYGVFLYNGTAFKK